MKLYRKLIRPMHCYPAQDYSPRVQPIEKEVKWYPEEEREHLEKKYASYNEGSFINLVFEVITAFTVAMQKNQWISLSFFYVKKINIHSLLKPYPFQDSL